MHTISRAFPEEVGLPSKSIYNFIQKLDNYNIPMHSILIVRQNKLITEAYYSPYKADTLHRMFSVSKNFTSIAIGQLIHEGKLTLEDKIVNYFSDKLPRKVHPFIAEMTISDMLKMQTCHSKTTYKKEPDSDWVESFFTTEPTHRPGTVFNYDTSSTHTLCALVERLTGQSLLDYLRESFLNKTEFSKEAYMIKDPFGISMGGSGLMAKPMDLLIFAMIIMNSGCFYGSQLVSESYIKEAISHQSNTLINGSILEECQGYGYQFWRIRHNGYACYGMGGQLAVCLPDYDLILVTTADTQGIQGGNQLIYNSFYSEILPFLSDKPLSPNVEDTALLNNHIKKLFIKPLNVSETFPVMTKIHNKTYKLEGNSAGFTSMNFKFNHKKREGLLTFIIDNNCHTLPFGFGHMVVSEFPIYNQKCATSGTWLSEDTLYIKSHIIDECIGSVHIHFVFRENTISIYMKKIEQTYFKEFSGYMSGKCF